MKRVFRKYHRLLAIAICFPLGLTVLSGIAATLVEEWGLGGGLISRSFLLSVHTGEIFHLEAIYPLLDGVGLMGLLVTGLTMSGLFGKKRPPRSI
ncbi:MAG: hypothetical protein OHK0035_24680 [Cyanobacteria bacterium J069]